jgi:N-acetylmuramoyl-L-alanine amidase
MTVRRLLHLASALSLGLTGLFADTAIATTFNNQDVNADRFVTVAAPFAGGSRHQLLILEQVSDRRQCWSESGSSPTIVNPLLVDFDFTGICSRSTDSNGYSVRLANDDMGWRYSLRVERQGNDLVLRAVPNDNRAEPGLEIGRTRGFTTDFAEIQLNPGWRLTRRVYNGQPLGHIYLTHGRSREVLVAEARQSSGAIATPGRPTLPQPPIVSQPSTPSSRPTPPSTSISIPSTPSSLPTIAEASSNQTRSYRVVVAAASPQEVARVRQVAPDAFRSVADGYTVMQAGIFQERDRAITLQEQLTQQNLNARILRSSADLSLNRPSPSAPSANLPIPTERALVVIDPGHGGRDPGAIGIGGLREKDVVLNISQQVSSLLEQQGLQTLMTRQDDREVDLAPRVAAAERANADVFVSIHANALSMSRPDVNGVETFYYSTGRSLAQSIQTNLVAETGMRDRGVKQARFYVLTRTSMPSVLVEVGFVTGSEDAPRLRDRAFQSRVAEAIARGILEHLR